MISKKRQLDPVNAMKMWRLRARPSQAQLVIPPQRKTIDNAALFQRRFWEPVVAGLKGPTYILQDAP